MFEILTVCTGNICRSPLAELLLRERLSDLPGRVHSAGTYDLGSKPMPADARRLAVMNGVSEKTAAAHRSRALTEALLSTPDLILVMTTGHRRHVLDLAPARMRATFTLREFARLAATAPLTELTEAADQAGSDPSARLRAACNVVGSYRALTPAARRMGDDDVVDPYGQPWETYQLSARQLVPAIDEVVRVVRAAVG